MFNVQTQDFIEASKKSIYESQVKVDQQKKLKTLMLAYIDSKIPIFEKTLTEAKIVEAKMMSIFKSPNVTLLTSLVFEKI